MTARAKGRALTDDKQRAALQAALDQLATAWPLDTEVRNSRNGMTGRVAIDEVHTIPGLHLGEPAAHCWLGAGGGVCVRWDNGLGVPWLAWVPATFLRRIRHDNDDDPRSTS